VPAQAQPQAILCPAIPEACPSGEGMLCMCRAAVAGETPHANQGFDRQNGRWPAETLSDVGRRWPMLGGMICTGLYGSREERHGHGDDPILVCHRSMQAYQRSRVPPCKGADRPSDVIWATMPSDGPRHSAVFVGDGGLEGMEACD
jgi:hypothetical protein